MSVINKSRQETKRNLQDQLEHHLHPCQSSSLNSWVTFHWIISHPLPVILIQSVFLPVLTSVFPLPVSTNPILPHPLFTFLCSPSPLCLLFFSNSDRSSSSCVSFQRVFIHKTYIRIALAHFLFLSLSQSVSP